MLHRCLAVVLLCAASLACGDLPADAPAVEPIDAWDGGGLYEADLAGDAGAEDAALHEPDAGPVITSASEHLRRCAAIGEGMPYPETIEAALFRINALPRPMNVGCFLASLPRPLSVVATRSAFSAQPANGLRSPRLFIMGTPLILSVVPDGPGAHLLEFGERTEDFRSVKGEVAFPVYEALGPTAPYSRVLFTDEVTSCGLCHREEWPSSDRPGAFESMAFRPEPNTELPMSDVRLEHDQCDPVAEPQRCEILDALFGFGPVVQGAFPEQMPTFF